MKISATMLSDWSRLLHSAVTLARLNTRRLCLDRAAILAVVFSAGAARAQWSTESYPLKAGYNAIWLSIDCSDRSIDTLLAAHPAIEEVWWWNATASAVQFTDSPAAPVQADSQWKVWKRGVPAQTTLGNLTANAAYLVKVATGTANYTLALTGRPEPPRYLWKSSGVNFFGFPIAETAPSPATQRSFTEFFKHNPVLNQSPPVFYYDGGDIAVNPRRLVAPNSKAVTRGQAYWVQTSAYTDYYGPLQVTAGTDGLDFGEGGAVTTVRIKNVTTRAVTVTLKPVASAAPPGSGAAYPAVAGQVPLKLRGAINPATLEFTYTPVTPSAPAVVVLAPRGEAGEEQEVVLGVDRTLMSGAAGTVYQSVLQISDSINTAPALTRIDLPVRAVTTSLGGLWVGGVALSSVERVTETTGPEFDAPLGTVNGSTAPAATTTTKTVATAAGVTTETVSVNPAAYDPATDDYDLPASGLNPALVTVTGPTGTPVYASPASYTLTTSQRLILVNGGSGYTSAPSVTFTGGGATTTAAAIAKLSALVTGATMTNGGSGYPAVTTVSITGDGTGAIAEAIVRDGIVTGLKITNPGGGYSFPPTIQITGAGGSGAAVTASISGSVSSVAITTAGAGYASVPVVSFSGGEGSGASATAAVAGGSVTGADVIHLVRTAGSAFAAGGTEVIRVTYATTRPAPAGTPEGTLSSTSTASSRLVTLNGKTRRITTTVESGGGARAPSNFPVRLIVHSGAAGGLTLLQQAFVGKTAAIPPVSLAGLTEAGVNALASGRMARLSSASFARAGSWTDPAGTLRTNAGFDVTMGYNDASNPFVHLYHPDHDNLDERFETTLPAGRESYTIDRAIQLTFSDVRPPGVSELTWGTTTLGGTYRETITGLRARGITLSGPFLLHRVSDAATLIP